MPPRLHAINFHVHHVRKPRKGKPIGEILKGRESPVDTLHPDTLKNKGVPRDRFRIIVSNEIETNHLAQDREHKQRQRYADRYMPPERNG